MTIDSNSLRRFSNLFSGAHTVYGSMDANGKMRTHLAALSINQYAEHLSGLLRLGITPLREDGRCTFGVLDYDDSPMPHAHFAALIESRRLPLVLCRNQKSGAGHFYHFSSEPLSPAHMRDRMFQYARTLGLPEDITIFPRSLEWNPGGWILLPYFFDDCPGLGPNVAGHNGYGELFLDEFLTYAESKIL